MIKLKSGFYELENTDCAYQDMIANSRISPEKLQETTVIEFVNNLLNEEDKSFPPICKFDDKWQSWNGFYEYNELFKEICEKSVSNPMFNGYMMEDGSVFCIYTDADCGGYDVEWKIIKYENLTEFKNAVLFGSQL